MKDKGKSDTATGCEGESQSEEMPNGRTVSEFLTTLRTSMEDKLQGEGVKPSIGDYLKVLQLEKEIDRKDAEEIQARWVDPEESVVET
jgi:hypothetical protein